MIFALVLCMVSTISFAQIQAIQTEKQRFEFLNRSLCYDTEEGTFDLIVSSDNQYEKKHAHLNLGKNPQEAITSLRNLLAAIQEPEAKFSIEGYDFYVVRANIAAILATGKLEYTAGTYRVTDSLIYSCIMDIVDRFNLEYGNYDVEVYTISSFAMLTFVFKDYGAHHLVTLNSKDYKKGISKYVQAEKGDILTSNQIKILADKIKDGTITKDKDSEYFLKVVDGTR